MDSSSDRGAIRADRIAGTGGLQTHGGADVTRQDLLDLFALVGVHLDEPANALFLVLGRVEDRIAGVQLARVDPKEAKLTRRTDRS